jgi:hypothetical protein
MFIHTSKEFSSLLETENQCLTESNPVDPQHTQEHWNLGNISHTTKQTRVQCESAADFPNNIFCACIFPLRQGP